jgi:hypothetical protein
MEASMIYQQNLVLIFFISLIVGCASAPSVDKIEIISVTPSASIDYNGSATAKVEIKLDKAVTATSFKGKVELWDDDGPADDLIHKKKNYSIRTLLTRKVISFTIKCTDKGELKGTSTDSDDGSDGETRVYELYAYETKAQKSSAEYEVTCVPPEEEEDDEGEGEGSKSLND